MILYEKSTNNFSLTMMINVVYKVYKPYVKTMICSNSV